MKYFQRLISQRNRFSSKIMLPLLCIGAAILTTSCQGGGSDSTSNNGNNGQPETEQKEGLKLATLAPITGDLASIGQNWPPAVQLAVDTINECGGVNV
jgi:neutral amino acid transport system substrate-binding protein